MKIKRCHLGSHLPGENLRLGQWVFRNKFDPGHVEPHEEVRVIAVYLATGVVVCERKRDGARVEYDSFMPVVRDERGPL